MKSTAICILIAISLMISACGGQPTSDATILPIVIPTPIAPSAQAPTEPPPTATAAAAATIPVAPTTTPAGAIQPDISSSVYLDDRSTPAALMLSYFNAINRHEYLRAYSYYTNFTEIGSLEQFTDGYSDTQSVSVVIGDIYNEGAAGSIYSTVPVIINTASNTGTVQKYSACYVLRLPQPGNFGEPPITPRHIERSTAQSVPLATPDAEVLAAACPEPDFPSGPDAGPPVLEQIDDLSSSNYIDNRSGPVEVISSLINAINRKEYVRAYSYWQESPGNFDTFAAGYADTASVTAQFGTATSDAGAGQIYYSLPTALESILNDGTHQTFIACYVLHLSQPGIQGTPPFAPLGIKSGTAHQVEGTSDISVLLATACE